MVLQTYLAFDLGAESGRGVLGTFDGERLALREVGRFPTTRGELDLGADGVRRWDFERIWGEIETITRMCESEAGGPLNGVGVDTWGVDFGLLDANGVLLEAPVCYRDDSHARARQELLHTYPLESLWQATGIQPLPFNTVFQLIAAQKRNPDILNQASRLLFMPDLLSYKLTNGTAMVNEVTIASTSQLLDPYAKQWNTDLMGQLGIPTHLFGTPTQPGTLIGNTPGGTPVFTVPGHDTASAVLAVPVQTTQPWAYLSSGTWSLVGVERKLPILTAEALRMGLSNETGIDWTTRLLKNIMGLWLVQECRRSLARAGQTLSYEELTLLAAAAPANGPLIDAAADRFLAPADMPTEIRAACTETGQTPPSDVGSLIRCCLESLALAYRRTLGYLGAQTNSSIEVLHIVGGGTKNIVLNQWAADACGIPVVAGPGEATAAGNILGQMVGSGAVKDWQEARTLSCQSFEPETYDPKPESDSFWQDRDRLIS